MGYSERKKSLIKAVENLKKTLKKRKTKDTRDLAIKRFELCFELCWKTIRDFLKFKGIDCRSPRDSFKELFKYGLIKEDDVWFEMIEDRNLAVYVYEKKLAEKIYSKLAEYLRLFEELNAKIK